MHSFISMYFVSPHCRNEFKAAVTLQKKIVLIHEIHPDKGGIPLSAHFAEAEKHFTTDSAEMRVLQEHMDKQLIVPWHRVACFQDLSLRQALAQMMGVKRDEVYAPREVTGAHQPSPKLASAGTGYHLYVSKNNPGAEERADMCSL